MKQICYCSSTSFSATVSVLIAGSNSEVSDTNTSSSELIHSFFCLHTFKMFIHELLRYP